MTLDAYLVIHCCSHCGKISIMELKKNSVVCPQCKTEEKVRVEN